MLTALRMSLSSVVENLQEVKIPKSLAGRIRQIAPYGQYDSLDSYVSTMLDEFLTQIEKVSPPRRRYNPFSENELAKIKDEIQDYALYP
jgi:hypothetical protein